MKKFRFSKQKLLEAREAAENGLQMQLAEKIGRVRHCRKEIKSLLREREREVNRIIRKDKLSGSGWSISAQADWIQAMDTRIAMLEKNLEALITERENLRAELASAMKERKVLQNLSDREKRQWREDYKRMEQKMLDEFASAGVMRKMHTV